MCSHNVDGVTLLKKGHSFFPKSPNEAFLETFKNAYPRRNYQIVFECPEFTTLCPVTNQPDFGHITIKYIPDKRCIESKSLKLYLFSFRDYHSFHEESVNRILDDIVSCASPRKAVVEGDFRPRGGIKIKVTSSYTEEDYPEKES